MLSTSVSLIVRIGCDDNHSKLNNWFSKLWYTKVMMAELWLKHMLFGISKTFSQVPPGTVSISVVRKVRVPAHHLKISELIILELRISENFKIKNFKIENFREFQN